MEVSELSSPKRLGGGLRLCTNCTRIQYFNAAQDSFERKTDFPISRKRQQLEVREGATGVDFSAPKAGVYAP